MRPGPGTADDERIDPRLERVEMFAHELVVAVVNAGICAPSTAQARSQLRDAVLAFGAALAQGAPAPLRIEAHGHALRWDGRDLLGASLQAGRLVHRMHERGVRALVFEPTLDGEALGRFLGLLDDPRQADAFRPGVLERVLRDQGIQGATAELGAPAGGPAPQSAVPGPDEDAILRYQELATVLQQSHVAASRGHELEIDLAQTVVERTVARMGAAPSDLLALAVYDDVDRFTVGHSVRVALIALEVARAAGASEHQLLLVGNAGLLHDIGKSRLPQEVLFKQGALDEDEWRAMAEHPRLGAQLLVEQDDVHPSAIGAAFCHHMAPAGGGYPDALVRFDPSGISRLIRICDVFEALTAVRPYKRDLTPLEAMARMNRQAEQFDRRWLRFFFRTVGIYPIGTRLRLDGGESALVVRHGSSCERPVVRLLTDAAGRPLAEDRPELEIGVPVDGRTPRVAAVLRRRGGQEYEDSSARAVAPIHHACLGPEPAGHDSRPHG